MRLHVILPGLWWKIHEQYSTHNKVDSTRKLTLPVCGQTLAAFMMKTTKPAIKPMKTFCSVNGRQHSSQSEEET
jgi:hypothetical protein